MRRARGPMTIPIALLVSVGLAAVAALTGGFTAASLVGLSALALLVFARKVTDRMGEGVRPLHLALWVSMLVATAGVCVPASRTCSTCSPVPPPGWLSAQVARAARSAAADDPASDPSPIRTERPSGR